MLQFNFRTIVLATCVAIGAASMGIMSCSKTTDTAAYSTFVHKWPITDTCSPYQIPSIDITAGANSYSLKVTYKMGYLNPIGGQGYDSCQREVTLDGIVNSTSAKDYFSIANQVVTDRCGNNYSISGGANIKRATGINNDRDTLFITLVTTTTLGSSACTYKSYIY